MLKNFTFSRVCINGVAVMYGDAVTGGLLDTGENDV